MRDAALVWFESPTNPALEVADAPAIIAAAHDAGARVVVDNTFLTPLLQRPLELGADVVLHSATKYLAGHSDVQLGAIVTRDDDLYPCSRRAATYQGNTPGPFEAWLALRGMRTLHLRVERAQANAAELARRLAEPPAAPPRSATPASAPWSRSCCPPPTHADLLVRATALWVHATSLGGVESSFERRRRWSPSP